MNVIQQPCMHYQRQEALYTPCHVLCSPMVDQLPKVAVSTTINSPSNSTTESAQLTPLQVQQTAHQAHLGNMLQQYKYSVLNEYMVDIFTHVLTQEHYKHQCVCTLVTISNTKHAPIVRSSHMQPSCHGPVRVGAETGGCLTSLPVSITVQTRQPSNVLEL